MGHFGEILLIVPYGIETTYRSRSTACGALLIVPYGIETSLQGRAWRNR